MSNDGPPSDSRRSYVKKLGAATVGLSLVPTATAGQRSRERTQTIHEAFQRKLATRNEEFWSLDRWYDEVEALGIEYGNKRAEQKVSSQVLSPFEDDDITLTLTYYVLGPPSSDTYDAIEMHWEFDNSGWDDNNTGKPEEIARIGINPDHYTKPSELDGDDWYDLGSSVDLGGPDAVSDGGLVGKYNGYYYKAQNPLIGDGETGGDLSLSDQITLYVDPDFSYSGSERRIHFSYSMLYDNATYGGSSAGTDGVISASIANEEDSWTVAPSYEESDIRGGKEYSK